MNPKTTITFGEHDKFKEMGALGSVKDSRLFFTTEHGMGLAQKGFKFLDDMKYALLISCSLTTT